MLSRILNKKLRKKIRIVCMSGNLIFLFGYLYRKQFYRRYAKKKSNGQAKIVMYSCVTGGYDKPKKIHNLKHEYDYVMFTDQPELYDSDDYAWDFRKLDFLAINDSKKSRYPKFNPHEILPGYDESVWIDANIDIISDTLYNDIEIVRKEKSLLAIGVHPKRNCIYQEFDRCIAGRIDEPEVIKEQMKVIKSSGYPAKNGLFENNIIYRRHHEPSVIQFGKDCWAMIRSGSKRDQLSLVFCAWKNNISITPLNAKAYRRMLRDLIMFPHG